MTLSAAAVAKRDTERFLLVRLAPARHMVSEFSSAGSNNYTATVTEPVARVTLNGADMTEGTPGALANGEYSYDHATSALVVNTTLGPPDDDDCIVVVYRQLFFTSKPEGITAYADPEDDETPLVVWKPKLLRSPNLSQSIANMVNGGVFTIQDSSVSIDNSDNAFQAYLGANDSFHDKAVDIWVALKSTAAYEDDTVLATTDNIQRIYTGKVRKIGVDRRAVTLNFYDSFSRLTQPAYMGDSVDECFAFRRTGGFPNLDPSKNGTPIPLVLGRQSKFNYLDANYALATNPGGLFADSVNHGACIDFSTSAGTSANREWVLGRLPKSIKVLNLGSGYSLASSGGSSLPFTLTATGAVGHNLEVGDLLQSRSGDPNPTQSTFNIWVVTSTTSTGWVARTRESFVGSPPNPNGGSWHALVGIDAPLVFLFEGNRLVAQLHSGANGGTGAASTTTDFTFTETTTAGGHQLIKIDLVDNFEAEYGITFHPSTHSIGYVMRQNDGDNLHGEVMQAIVEAAGLEVDQDSFDDANTGLAVNALFQIPYEDETEYGDYLRYAQDLCESALAVLSLTDDGKAKYDLLAAPGAGDVESDDRVIEGSMSIDVEYNDIYTSIETSNPHYASVDAMELADGPNQSRTNNVAIHLHEVKKNRIFKHLLEGIGTRVDAILSVISNRFATYRFAFAKKYIDGNLNDDVTITDEWLLGAAASDNLKILGIDKSEREVSIVATDLEGFEA